ncbi:MAG: hypothetical protein AAF223_11755, partial [Bacteroidota bacterium]
MTFWILDHGIGSFVGKIKLSPLSLVHEMVYDPAHIVTFGMQRSNGSSRASSRSCARAARAPARF